jgi:hypothetical protein
MASAPRGVIFEARFEREAAAIDGDVRRMDEALRYVEQVLTVDPEFGLETATPDVWVAPIVFADTTTGVQAASIFYTFTDTHVRYLSIRADW